MGKQTPGRWALRCVCGMVFMAAAGVLPPLHGRCAPAWYGTAPHTAQLTAHHATRPPPSRPVPPSAEVKSAETVGPVLVHIVTEKGRGYLPAETAQDKMHGVVKFDPKTGQQVQVRPGFRARQLQGLRCHKRGSRFRWGQGQGVV